MAEMNDIVRLAVDTYKGKVEKYSTEQASKVLQKALIDANNGKTSFDYRDIRDGKCAGLFTLVEQIITATAVEGLQGDEFFNTLVDFRNVAEGDQNVFVVEDSTLFAVADMANGTQGIRRQRIGGRTETAIKTAAKGVRFYEELNRILAGRVDINEFIARVSKSVQQRLLNDIYNLWASATAEQMGGVAYFPVAGSYNEDTLLETISHTEAAAGGKRAVIVGTKKGLRKLKESIQSNTAKDELHAMGFYGTFYGTPCVAVPQRHKIGSTEFVMDDNVLTIIAGDDKPIKVVYEGDALIIPGNPMDNVDLTQEYFITEKWGMGIVLAGGNSGIGRYEMTA